ncbi:hypothetical protein [Duganella sp. BuS-21]
MLMTWIGVGVSVSVRLIGKPVTTTRCTGSAMAQPKKHHLQ